MIILPIFSLLKKPIAILLLIIYLFNLGGYSLVFHYFIYQSEERFVQQLEQNRYNESELVQISIPLHLPYLQNSNGFEQIEGSFENNGTEYNYVKRMVHNDTLYIMCLPNKQKTQLEESKSNYAGKVNDFANNKKDRESSSKKASPGAEYNNTIAEYRFITLITESAQQNDNGAYPLHSLHSNTPEHPPKFSC